MILAQIAHTRMHGGRARHGPGVFRDFDGVSNAGRSGPAFTDNSAAQR